MFSKLLTSSATTQRVTNTTSGMGATKQTWETNLASFPCRIWALRASERAMSGSTGVNVTHKMACDIADIVEADRVVSGGVTYEVKFVNNVAGHHLEVELEQRKPERGT